MLTLLVSLFVGVSLRYILLEPERLIEIIRHKTRELERLAFYDPLTGLTNRRLFLEKLSIACSYSDERHCALMFIDLDRFKEINDSLGHDAGDVLLATIAERLSNRVGEKGLVARLGGDEFAILLSDYQNRDTIRLFTQGMLALINEPMNLQGKYYSICASIGITLIPEDGCLLEEALCHADMAMYKVKESGRNNFYFFRKELKQSASKQEKRQQSRVECLRSTDEELASALEKQELTLSYQPLISIQDDSLVACEVLIRWHHPEKGILHNGVFWSLAQESKQIVEVGYWILKQVALMLRSQLDKNDGVTQPVCLNMTLHHLTEPNFVNVIADTFESIGVPAHYFVFELDESIILNGSTSVTEVLVSLREMGVSISVDGVGDGYLSLSRLPTLPIDMIKIAPQFIRHLETSREHQSLVHDIISFAHTIGVKVVAEGVERDAQVALLTRYGCDIGQGYLYSKPMDKTRLDIYVLSKKHQLTGY